MHSFGANMNANRDKGCVVIYSMPHILSLSGHVSRHIQKESCFSSKTYWDLSVFVLHWWDSWVIQVKTKDHLKLALLNIKFACVYMISWSVICHRRFRCSNLRGKSKFQTAIHENDCVSKNNLTNQSYSLYLAHVRGFLNIYSINDSEFGLSTMLGLKIGLCFALWDAHEPIVGHHLLTVLVTYLIHIRKYRTKAT